MTFGRVAGAADYSANPSLKRGANGMSPYPRSAQVIVSLRRYGATPLSPA